MLISGGLKIGYIFLLQVAGPILGGGAVGLISGSLCFDFSKKHFTTIIQLVLPTELRIILTS